VGGHTPGAVPATLTVEDGGGGHAREDVGPRPLWGMEGASIAGEGVPGPRRVVGGCPPLVLQPSRANVLLSFCLFLSCYCIHPDL
jgi:hypothetical protein